MGRTANGASAPPTGDCGAVTRIDTLPPILREASGIAVSHARPDILWVHNDSNNPFVIVALDTLGRVRGRVRIDTTRASIDWEDIAVARCGDADCIYLADIGDNYSGRDAVSILRFGEPDPGSDSVATPDVFPFRFPDGPRDAEAMFILPGERVFIITKGRSAAAALYAYPGSLRSDTVTLTHVRDLTAGIAQFPNMVTGAAASPDGQIVAVRTYSFLRLYTPATGGDLTPVGDSIPLRDAHEFQGEGVSVAPDRRIFLVGEKGFDTVPPPLSVIRCR